jgi:hypothetical protein
VLAPPVVEVDPWDLPDEPMPGATATPDTSFDFGHNRFDRLRNEIQGARNLRELRALGGQIGSAVDTDEALVPGMRDTLRSVYAERLRTLRGPELPVWRDRYAPGWPASDTGRATVTPLVAMLTTAYSTDAHFAAYRSPQANRLTVDAAGKVPIDMVALVVDVDGPGHGRTDAWDDDQRERSARLPFEPFGYFTRGGVRYLWRLSRPVSIRSADAAARWTRFYCAALLDVCAASGIVPDPSCRAWPWLFRAPMATRDGVPQRHPIACGALDAVGAWPVEGDVGLESRREAVLADLRRSNPARWKPLVEILSPRRAAPRTPYARTGGGGAGALAYAERRLREAGPGERNRTLFAQAAWLAELSSEGRVAWSEAVSVLTNAGAAAGLVSGEVHKTIASAAKKAP